MKRTISRITALGALLAMTATIPAGAKGNGNGGINPSMMQELRQSYTPDAAARALSNAAAFTSLDKLASTPSQLSAADAHFSHRVPSKGITDQKSSGRCWLFTGLNVLRSQMMRQHGLPTLKLSQNYNFFYDQLEKANLFLQAIIDTADKPMTDRTVDFLFSNPVSDGGQFTGLSDNIMKYGVVPAEAMCETFSAENTSQLRRLLSLKLREDGLKLRESAAKASPEQLKTEKTAMLKEIYGMLARTLGVPPTEFTWTRRNKDGKALCTKTYTPLSFYKEFAGNDLKRNYVMLMNDPGREFYKLYEIDLDRHTYDGENWTYVNLPVEDIKQMAIAAIKDSTAMYFSCDVGKFFDRKRGVLDINNYDYDDLMGVTFGMDKADRIRTHASASSHAMTLVAVDLDKDGKPLKWMVENSWGPGANDGHLIMTDKWFDEYMFRLVVDRKYVPKRVLDILKQTPITLPAWDPLFRDM